MSEVINGGLCKVDYSGFSEERDYALHVASLADREIPKVKSIHTGRNPDDEIKFIFEKKEKGIAGTVGKDIYLNLNWFNKIRSVYGDREDDDGAIVHEISHAILWAPDPNDGNKAWLFEALADYVRHKRGYRREAKEKGGEEIPKGYPHYETGKALSSPDSQVCAHFLLFLQGLQSQIVEKLVDALVNNTYDETIFPKLFGEKSLQELVEMYEEEEEKKRRPKPWWESLVIAIVEFFRRITGRK